MNQDMTDMKQLPEYQRIHLPEDIEMTGDLVEQLIEHHEEKKARYEILDGYYRNRTPLLNREKPDDKANNKILNDYAAYITDIATGIFIGKPIKYTVADEFKEDMEEVQKVFDYNDEEDENHEIAKQCSKFGVGYQIVYTCEEGYVRISELDPRNVIYVYDNKINASPLFAIYYINTINEEDIFDDDTPVQATVYTRDRTMVFMEGEGGFTLENEEVNLVEGVPVIEYMNNNEYIGDFEKVIPLIDAYNKARSDTANDFEEFTDAILLLMGMLNTDSDDIAQMKKDKAILLAEGQGADWLIKEINDIALENHLDRLDADIHKFAKVPNLGDEQFAGNSSGVALAYKLIALRQIIASKQRKFKSATEQRLELIIELLKEQRRIKNEEFYHRDIQMTFTENIPINIKENVETVALLKNLVSESTYLAELYCVKDVNEEKERMEEESNPYSLEELEDEVLDEEEVMEDEEDKEERAEDRYQHKGDLRPKEDSSRNKEGNR